MSGCALCEKPKPQLILTNAPVPITDTQFDCGPRPQNWPEAAVLKKWKDSDLVDYANSNWFWGHKCDVLLQWNKLYFHCINGEQEACIKLKYIKGPDGTSTKP